MSEVVQAADWRSAELPPAPVTVSIPFFNEPDGAVERTLRSLLAQSRPPERIVVVDDASARPPELPEELRGVAEVLRLRENGGCGVARNEGVQLAESDLLLFLDCDLILGPGWLEHGVAYLERHPDVGAVSGALVPLGGPRVLRDWRLHHIEPKVHRSVITRPTKVVTLGGHSILVRREIFEELGGFDPQYRSVGEDWDFAQRVRARGDKLIFLPELVAECYEVTSVDVLARKSVRNANWDVRLRQAGATCIVGRRVRLFAATAGLLQIFLYRAARDLVRRRFRLLPWDAAIGARSLALVWGGWLRDRSGRFA